MMDRKAVVTMAHHIIDMDIEIYDLKKELKRLEGIEKKYQDLLNSSIAHNQKMMVNVLDIVMIPGVIDAIRTNNDEKGEQHEQLGTTGG